MPPITLEFRCKWCYCNIIVGWQEPFLRFNEY